MSETKEKPGVNRRRFLQQFGLVAGALAADPIQGLASASVESGPGGRFVNRHALNIGLLLPGGPGHAALRDNLEAGLRLFLRQADDGRVKLVTGLMDGGSGLARTVTRRMIEEEGADIVVAAINPATATQLAEICDETRTCLVVCEGGANIVRDHEQSPYIYYNTFHYWQANRALGEWAARNVGQRALVATSLYESGYDSLYAFRLGFQAGGGEIAATHVTPEPAGPGDIDALLGAIEEVRPDFVFALYSGPLAVKVGRAYQASGLDRSIPLLAGGFMVDEPLLPALGRSALGIRSCLPWSPELDLPENRSFCAAFRAAAGRRPDVFSVLGYETARWVLEASNQVQGRVRPAGRFLAALAAVEFDGPRGWVAADPVTRQLTGPLYLRQVDEVGGTPANRVMARLDDADERSPQVSSLRARTRSGWVNVYPSV